MDNHSFEVIVIGAGLSGIIAAQRYLDVHPKARIAILEKDADIGGVFSRRRMYDAFWTQWTVGLSEFSDMPMTRPPEADCRHDFYRAKYTTDYLEQYVSRKNEDGSTLRDKFIFGMDVKVVKKASARWEITCDTSEGVQKIFLADKVMVASGLTSVPNMPSLPGLESFNGLVLHSEDFGAHEAEILKSESIQKITVVGAGKSSADMIYEAVKAGKQVSWLIRTTGAGAAFFAPGHGRGGYKNAFEAASTRMVASINPSIFNSKNIWTRFIQGTSIGNGLLRKLIAQVDGEMRAVANYKGRKSDKGFEKLEYEAPFFWQNGTGGLLHHDDFWDTIADNVYVYRDQIASLSQGTIHLEDGEEIQSDAILCGTGWNPSIQFFSEDLLVNLELPHDPEAESIDTTEKWARLDAEADKTIKTTYPLLANPPPHPHRNISTTPYRLYQGMAPLCDGSILMMNHINTGNKLFAAEAQAMWAVAYFDKQMTLPVPEDMERDIALWVAFSRRRYLSAGEAGNFISFESITYVDRLLREMGLAKHKKGWWKQNFEPFWPRDLGRAWAEYRERVGAVAVGKGSEGSVEGKSKEGG